MILVLDAFKDIDEYRSDFRPNSLPKPEVCAVCSLSATLAYNGTYSRGVVVAVSFTFCEIRIQRLRCRACRVTFSLLPCFLLPRRQYEASIVAELSLTYIEGDSFYRRTVRDAADDPESNRPAHNTLWYWLSFWGCAEWTTEVLQRLLTHIARCFPRWSANSQLSRPDDIDESKYRSDERRDLLCRLPARRAYSSERLSICSRAPQPSGVSLHIKPQQPHGPMAWLPWLCGISLITGCP